MLIDIDKVQIKDRIRKDFGNIEELAQDIKDNGLINPPVVTPEFELIAGERRLRAMKYLNYSQIEVRIMTVKDYEHQLNLEISENESRKEFSKLERLDYARRLEQVERMKAEERMKSGGVENFPQGKTRDIVAEKIGIGSGKQYEKEKYIAENASPETLESWDKGDITTHKAYQEAIKAKKEAEERANKAEATSDLMSKKALFMSEKVDTLQEKVKELENKEPEVVEREKIVFKVPEDVKNHIKSLEVDIQTYKMQLDSFKNDSEQLKKIQSSIKHLESHRDKLNEYIFNFDSVVKLKSGIEAMFKHELAVVRYGPLLKAAKENEKLAQMVDEILDMVRSWVKDMEKEWNQNNIIEARVI